MAWILYGRGEMREDESKAILLMRGGVGMGAWEKCNGGTVQSSGLFLVLYLVDLVGVSPSINFETL